MKKRILILSLSVTIIGILLISVLYTDIFYRKSLDTAKDQLKKYSNFYDSTEVFDEAGATALSEKLGGIQVTYLLSDGSIVADTLGESGVADGEEISEALKSGEGYAVRADGGGKDRVYYCFRLSVPVQTPQGEKENCLVRLSLTLADEFSAFSGALPTMIWFLVLDILCCFGFSWLVSGSVLKPVERFTKDAATVREGEIRTDTPELKPIAKLMNEMNADIDKKVARIKEDSRLEKLILDSMEHGIVIFRDPSDVVLINKTAVKLLDYEQNEPIGLFLTDKEISTILSEREASLVYRKFSNKDYALRFTFGEDSAVLLMTDVTETLAASRSKDEFIANVTHEMNTPLTSIRGYAELIEANAVPPEKIGDAAKIIRKQSDRLSNLIRSIINFSAIDSDALPAFEVNVSDVIGELLPGFEPKIGQKNITLTSQIEPNVKVITRRERLVEIVNNLISNGIRYNKEGGLLDVRLTGGEEPVLTVKDTGIGLSEEDKTRIFDRFYTVDKSHNGSGGGFGLGLAIVKKICKREGWSLSVDSALGEGTKFTIVFHQKKEETK